ncbi:MAG: hypothetical protein HC763_28885 [Hydrococcus sp. CRU_1_1]|nr:hypothetical protein [Hydrococcus sp. CRU_1_1]
MKEAKNCAGGEWLRSAAKITDFSLNLSSPSSFHRSFGQEVSHESRFRLRFQTRCLSGMRSRPRL